ncbi:MAG TPA: nicotinate-nucleotide--dimethylbenzimidazole phosphoribosyltransferase, partial [Nitrospiraceae bacterium]|nr:nicotinate-nucleotide--dimethylbenzimidazole phosphoribosyltransferase [Nitrospiraceae bacterium]
MTIDDVLFRIQPPDRDLLERAQRRLNSLTKPPGSLGRLEELAACYVMLTGKLMPDLPRAAIYTFAADHRIVQEGVSAYPSEVTAQMVLNFLRGGAGVNVLARHADAEVRVVDIGVASEFPALPHLIQRKIAPGTKNFLHEPAMTREQ